MPPYDKRNLRLVRVYIVYKTCTFVLDFRSRLGEGSESDFKMNSRCDYLYHLMEWWGVNKATSAHIVNAVQMTLQ